MLHTRSENTTEYDRNYLDFLDRILSQNGVYCVGNGSTVSTFGYSSFKALTVWYDKDEALKSLEAVDFTVGGINIYEFAYYTLPYIIESTWIKYAALCNDEGNMYVISLTSLQDDILQRLESRLEPGNDTAFEHFTDDTFDPRAEENAVDKAGIQAMPVTRKYEFFLSSVSQLNKIWFLADQDANVETLTDDEGREMMLLWPSGWAASDYAEMLRKTGRKKNELIPEWINPFEFVFRAIPSYETTKGIGEADILVFPEIISSDDDTACKTEEHNDYMLGELVTIDDCIRGIRLTRQVFCDNLSHMLFHKGSQL